MREKNVIITGLLMFLFVYNVKTLRKSCKTGQFYDSPENTLASKCAIQCKVGFTD